MRERRLLGTGLAAVGLGLLGLMLNSPRFWSPWLSDLTGPPASAQVASPWDGRASGQVAEVQLTVGRTQWELAPGRTVEAYTYNGQLPGPELRVTEGDTVRVTVHNALAEPTTVHWHGVEVPVGMDGVPRLSQEPIPPGDTFTYQFVATPAGTRWYHSHFDEMTEQGGGLVGALIVEPRLAVSPAPDREYVLVSGEWVSPDAASRSQTPSSPSRSRGRGGMMSGMMGGAGRALSDTFLVNGKSYPNSAPLLVREGERVRLRLINGGVSGTQTFSLAGHQLTLTHTDGNSPTRPVAAESVQLGVGERADVEFLADHPGRWQLRGVVSGQAEPRLAVDVVYDGHDADPAQASPNNERSHPVSYAQMAGLPHPARPDRTFDLTLSGGMMGSDVWTINGKSAPNTDPLSVRHGERVRIKLFNMSMEDHPMHLHGHTFQVVGIGGRPVDGPLKDTITVQPMEQYEIQFVANNPGAWLLHCHRLEHMEGGLMTELHYQ